MKVSFVITAYERWQHLRTCLSSICAQTEPSWEAIVVDNSINKDQQERHETMCWMDERIRYRNTEKETVIPGPHIRCLYTATEIGVKETTGEWLCFPNDDSYYCPWFLERMLSAAEQNSWDLVYSDLVAGGHGGHFHMSAEPRECCIDKTCFMVKRSWFEGFKDKAINYHTADGRLIEDLVRRGISHGRVPQILVVHN